VAAGSSAEPSRGSGESTLGLSAARRAVHVEGTLPDLDDALVVQLESTYTIAQGRVPWGVLPHLSPARAPLRVAADSADPVELRALAAGRPVVVVGRHLHRLPGAAALIEALAGSGCVVAVEMGWPSTWRPVGVTAFVTTYGSSRASGRAAAEALGLAA
jgi:beta-N-acetylhexosaminidase